MFRSRLPATQMPVMTCTSSPRSCGCLYVVPPGQISLSVCQTPTESTPGLWMPLSHRWYIIMLPSPSAVGVPPPPVVDRHLGPGLSSPPSVPRLFCCRCYFLPPFTPPWIPSGKPRCPPPASHTKNRKIELYTHLKKT